MIRDQRLLLCHWLPDSTEPNVIRDQGLLLGHRLPDSTGPNVSPDEILMLPEPPMELDMGIKDGEMGIDNDTGEVKLGPGMAEHFELMRAIRNTIIDLDARRRIAERSAPYNRAQSAPPKFSSHRGPSTVIPLPLPFVPLPIEPIPIRSKVRQHEVEDNIWQTPDKSPSKRKQRGVEPSSIETRKYATPGSDATIDYGSPQGTPGGPLLGQPVAPEAGAPRSSAPTSQPRLPIEQPGRPFRMMPKGYAPFKSNIKKIMKLVDCVKKWGGQHEDDLAKWNSSPEDEDETIVAHYAKQWNDWEEELDNALDCDGWYLSELGIKGLVPLSTGNIPRDLTREEILANPDPVNAGKLKELQGLCDLGCFERCP